MASKNAILQCYNLLSANVPIIKAQTNKDLMIVLGSWQMALEDLTDTELFASTKRFLKEVTDVNRGVVITKLLIDLAKPQQMPFDGGEVIEIVNKLMQIPDCAKYDEFQKLKKENPLACEAIERYGWANIQNGNSAVVFSQLKKEYETLHQKQQTINNNGKLEAYKLEFKDGLKMLEAA